MEKPTQEQIKELEKIRETLLQSARLCPVCKSDLIQKIHWDGGRYYLTFCVCSNCGVRIEKYRFPMIFIENNPYAKVEVCNSIYGIDSVGRTYRITQETKTATYVSGAMGQPGHEYTSDYTVDVLHWVGLIDEFWSEPLW